MKYRFKKTVSIKEAIKSHNELMLKISSITVGIRPVKECER